MQKDVEEFLVWFESADCNIWEINTYLHDKEEQKTLLKIFSAEQLIVLQSIVKQSIKGLDEFHNSDDSEAHEDLRHKIKKIEAHLRNHRHDYSKTFTGKAEY